MTPAASIIARVRSLGAALSASDQRLIIDAPRGVITQELRDEIVRLKSAILAELNATSNFVVPPRETLHEVANLLAIAFNRHRAARRSVGESSRSSDSQLANSGHQSVHGGKS